MKVAVISGEAAGFSQPFMLKKITPKASANIMDINASTGGYNFQAAWSTEYISGKLKN